MTTVTMSGGPYLLLVPACRADAGTDAVAEPWSAALFWEDRHETEFGARNDPIHGNCVSVGGPDQSVGLSVEELP